MHIAGGLELSRSFANVSSDSAGIILDASSRPATTLSGNVHMEWGRLSILGAGGISLTDNNRGGYGRGFASLDLIRSRYSYPLLQLAVDYTNVQSPLLPVLSSSGISLKAGDPSVFQGGIRVGSRSRSFGKTSTTSLDLGRVFMAYSGKTLLSAYLSAAAILTRVPLERNLPSISGDSASPILSIPMNGSGGIVYSVTRPVTVGDLGLNVQAIRGNWGVGARGTLRVGRSVNLWDDPVPHSTVLRQEADGKMAAVGRIMWEALPNFTVTAEGGRQLSDPILGVSGVRYASLSARMSFDAGKRRKGWLQRKRIDQAADLLRDLPLTTPAIAFKAEQREGSRTLVFRDIKGFRVEVAGNFTNWQPVRLRKCTPQEVGTDLASDEPARADETWCGKFTIATGVYHILYRVDGGEWQVPPGLSEIADSFDGTVGLLIVP